MHLTQLWRLENEITLLDYIVCHTLWYNRLHLITLLMNSICASYHHARLSRMSLIRVHIVWIAILVYFVYYLLLLDVYRLIKTLFSSFISNFADKHTILKLRLTYWEHPHIHVNLAVFWWWARMTCRSLVLLRVSILLHEIRLDVKNNLRTVVSLIGWSSWFLHRQNWSSLSGQLHINMR